jgi:glycosyltransferase involved in cell wall biosynthesis
MLKVAWICHFHNESLNRKLILRRKIHEFAPWISQLISIFENDKEIELHIIAPHNGIKKDQCFMSNGISYYFYSVGLPIHKKYNLSIIDLLTNYFNPKRKVKKYIDLIKPDLIHLYGAENAYYSSTIFQFKEKYPILVSIQGFLFNTLLNKSLSIRKRIHIEEKILVGFSHYGIRTNFMAQEVRKYNSAANLHWHWYPIFVPNDLSELHRTSKEFDLVYFARITKDKGIEDLILAIQNIKLWKPDVQVVVIGEGEPDYTDHLIKQCQELNLSTNIYWAGFIPTQIELFRLCSKARICVLPSYYDIIPGTVIESMLLKIPVIAYNVGGIPEINRDQEVIKLVQKGDIIGLSEVICELLKDQDELVHLKELAFLRAQEMFDRNSIRADIIKAYYSILENGNEYE